MKRIIKSITVLLLSAVLLFSALPFISFAAPENRINLSFSETEDGKTVISVILPPSDKLTAVDFSLVISSDTAVIEALSTENTDIKNMIYDFDCLPEDSTENEVFTYTATKKSDRISFSGFFLYSFTTEEDLHLCNIIIQSDREFTENDVFRFSYTLTCEESKETESHAYSLLNKDLSEKKEKRSYPSGDANLDGIVDSSDARLILRASVGLETLCLEESPYADSDCDGKITATDARFSLRFSVGLEEAVLHSFDISLEEGKNCEDGGNYTFTCSITGRSFTMEIANGGHICHDTDCINTGNCEICNEAILPATGHKFDKNGICTECKADKALLDEATEMLIPLLEEIHISDSLADEALHKNMRTDFIFHTQEATKSIRKAAVICQGITGMNKVEEHLMTAYNIRFQAFASVMDENGEILSNASNCNVILTAVKQSNQHIDYASYLYV